MLLFGSLTTVSAVDFASATRFKHMEPNACTRTDIQFHEDHMNGGLTMS